MRKYEYDYQFKYAQSAYELEALGNPEGYFSEYNHATTPEEKLVTFALIDACIRAIEGDADEIVWIYFDPSVKRPFCFAWCCNMLGIDGDSLRERMSPMIGSKHLKGSRWYLTGRDERHVPLAPLFDFTAYYNSLKR